jgi:hypothetical protein
MGLALESALQMLPVKMKVAELTAALTVRPPYRCIGCTTDRCSIMVPVSKRDAVLPLSYFMLCYAMLCYAMLCYVTRCYALLCCRNSPGASTSTTP